jgi:hypothetical protein
LGVSRVPNQEPEPEPKPEHADADSMQQRITRLENLVKTLVTQGPEHARNDSNAIVTPPDTGFDVIARVDQVDDVTYSGGTTEIDERKSVYKSANDWSGVLQEVS